MKLQIADDIEIGLERRNQRPVLVAPDVGEFALGKTGCAA